MVWNIPQTRVLVVAGHQASLARCSAESGCTERRKEAQPTHWCLMTTQRLLPRTGLPVIEPNTPVGTATCNTRAIGRKSDGTQCAAAPPLADLFHHNSNGWQPVPGGQAVQLNRILVRRYRSQELPVWAPCNQ